MSPTGSKEGESQRNLHVVLFGHGPLGCATFLRLLEEKSVSRITLAGDDVLTPGLACNVQKNRDLFREIKMGKPVWEYLRGENLLACSCLEALGAHLYSLSFRLHSKN